MALKQQMHAAALGVQSPGLTVLAAYLRGDTAAMTEASPAANSSPEWSDAWSVITYLADSGQVEQAARFGEAAAGKMDAEAPVASSAGLMRARLSAVRAMTGHCDSATQARSVSEPAAYYAAISAAWCHRPATDVSEMKNTTLLAIARSAQAWAAGDAAGALDALSHARPGAQATVAALLRGEAHLLQKQQVVAIGDYRAVITHRGAALLTGTPAFPAAHAGLAMAYRSMGDEPNSARVQSDLQTLWAGAPKTEPLLHRAAK